MNEKYSNDKGNRKKVECYIFFFHFFSKIENVCTMRDKCAFGRGMSSDYISLRTVFTTLSG